jgi:hypothetical protein
MRYGLVVVDGIKMFGSLTPNPERLTAVEWRERRERRQRVDIENNQDHLLISLLLISSLHVHELHPQTLTPW